MAVDWMDMEGSGGNGNEQSAVGYDVVIHMALVL